MKKALTIGACGFLLVATLCRGQQAAPLAADFAVRKIYSKHMVLQRDRPIKIAGTAEVGKAVVVKLAGNSVTAVADANGEWTAVLPAMPAGGPHVVSVSGANGKQISFDDVLIGEVWLCSGQSNMSMPVFSSGQFWSAMNGEEEARQAHYPQIRLHNTSQKRGMAPEGPRKEIAGPEWVVCTPDSAAPFSAAGYFFGRQLFKELGVPIGLIDSSWGGTPIESWISEEGFRSANLERDLERIRQGKLSPEEIKALEEAAAIKAKEAFVTWEKRFFTQYQQQSDAARGWSQAELSSDGWATVELPDERFPRDMDGVIWYRRAVSIPADWVGKDLVLSLGAIDDCDETYFNGELVGKTGTDTADYWATPRQYTVPGAMVKAGQAVIAVRVIDYHLDGGFTGKAAELSIAPKEGGQGQSLAGSWLSRTEFVVDPAVIGKRPEPTGVGASSLSSRKPGHPTTLYNAMIAPWTIYPIRGAIWYQGESNAGAYERYMTLHPLLIQDWRRLWQDPDLAFIFVQLAAYERHRPKERLADDFWVGREPSDGNWPKLREVQTATLKIPRTGMAVTIDAGDHSDIHPANKQIVGYRLAKEAMRICYGFKGVSAGPLYKDMAIEGNRIRIHFDNAASGLVSKGGEPTSFAIAGADGVFVWANAKIEGTTIVVWSDKVPEPKAVRYAWASYPGNANLFNRENFPASPFRTDMPDYLIK
ncbi:MAG: sialate O-acetylesterase [Lentisphaeria bacterium]|jgi:sialate O-acetylesterase